MGCGAGRGLPEAQGKGLWQAEEEGPGLGEGIREGKKQEPLNSAAEAGRGSWKGKA